MLIVDFIKEKTLSGLNLLKEKALKNSFSLVMLVMLILSLMTVGSFLLIEETERYSLNNKKAISMFVEGQSYPDFGFGFPENKKLIQEQCRSEKRTGVVLYLGGKERYFLKALEDRFLLGQYITPDVYYFKLNSPMTEMYTIHIFEPKSMVVFDRIFQNFCSKFLFLK